MNLGFFKDSKSVAVFFPPHISSGLREKLQDLWSCVTENKRVEKALIVA